MAASDNTDRQRLDIHLHLPTRTVVKVLATALVVWAGLRLWPEFIFVVIALLLAVALHPVVVAFERRGLRRGLVVAGLAVVMIAGAVLLVVLVSTALSQQLSALIQDFPGFRERVVGRLPATYPGLKRLVAAIFALLFAGSGRATAPAPGARHGLGLRHRGGRLHADRHPLPAARRQAALRLAHRLRAARAAIAWP